MITIKAKSLNRKNKKIPAFLTLSLPIMCVAMVMFIKMFSLMCLIVVRNRQAVEDQVAMEKVKSGILNYMKNQGTLPPINENGEINYNYHISHYIPPNYRLDHRKKPFKLTIYNKNFINRDLSYQFHNNNEAEDLNLICVISQIDGHHTKKVTIYFGDLENANITIYGNNSNNMATTTNSNTSSSKDNKTSSLANVKHLFVFKSKKDV